MMELYERGLNAAHAYAPYLFGPGSGPFASAVLNEVLGEDLFRGGGVEELRAGDPDRVQAAAREMMLNAPIMRELLAETLWLKWAADRAYNRTSAIQCLESSWAFREYASERGLPSLEEYEKQILLVEQEAKAERARWIEAMKSAGRGGVG
jgi:hypothetical protein